jgi:hypothetical protein
MLFACSAILANRMVPDLARMRAELANIDRTLELNRAALEISRRRLAEYGYTLAVASVEAEYARRELRKCGLL